MSCPSGGTEVRTGIDQDGDGRLSEGEVAARQFICNGDDGTPTLVSAERFAAGEGVCPAGGVRIASGPDTDGNGVLDPSEVVVTEELCDGNNGQDGQDGQNGQDGQDGTDGASALLAIDNVPPGTDCATGGQRVSSGLDANGNGQLDAGEVARVETICNGADGDSARIRALPEPPGGNCAEGGQRIEIGLDANGNGVLDDAEVQSVAFVCNGLSREGPDAGVPDAGFAEDASTPDAEVPDLGPPDSGVFADAEVPDSGGFADAEVADTGEVADAGMIVPDAGFPDATPPDTGSADAGFAEAGVIDAGLPADGGLADAGGGRPDFGPFPLTRLWQPNDFVSAIARYGRRLYIGGRFTALSPPTGSTTRFSLSSGQRSRQWPQYDARIDCIEPDGRGGWYVAGFSFVVGGRGRFLVRFDGQGRVDPTFQTDTIPPILAIKRVGDRLYAAGGQSAGVLYTLSATTGASLAPRIDANGVIHSVFPQGNRLYVSGEFSTIAGQSRGRAAAIDMTSGTLESWDPALNATAFAVAATSDRVFLGGSFTRVGFIAQPRLAAVSTSAASLIAWTYGPNDVILDLEIDGGFLYAAGEFTNLGPAGFGNGLAKIRLSDFALQPNWPGAGAVTDVVIDGDRVGAVGSFQIAFPGVRRTRAFVFDQRTNTTLLDQWPPRRLVTAIGIQADAVMVGGTFDQFGVVERAGLAAINADTGELDMGWEGPPINTSLSIVNDIKMLDDEVLVAGTFAGASRFAKLDAVTGAQLPFTVTTDAGTTVLEVVGGNFYISGSFSTIQGVSRPGLALVNGTTGAVDTTFRPTLRSIFTSDLHFDASRQRLYFAGAYSTPGLQRIRGLFAVSATTGATVSSFSVVGGSEPRDIIVDGNRIFVAGSLQTLAGVLFNGLGVVDATSGGVNLGWFPGQVSVPQALLLDGGRLFAGRVTTIGPPSSRTINGIALLDPATGAVLADRIPVNGTIAQLLVDGDVIFAVGGFTEVGNGLPRSSFAAFDRITLQAER